jgi:hypothetical protein
VDGGARLIQKLAWEAIESGRLGAPPLLTRPKGYLLWRSPLAESLRNALHFDADDGLTRSAKGRHKLSAPAIQVRMLWTLKNLGYAVFALDPRADLKAGRHFGYCLPGCRYTEWQAAIKAKVARSSLDLLPSRFTNANQEVVRSFIRTLLRGKVL